ncbi:XtrA/YqaO family protein [Brevibacillus porteri]|uniref:XtrA/YqaO family protein n=1 Tax=Brevibacillus porteri TaxID=2126350 RepID=UPI00370B00F5
MSARAKEVQIDTESMTITIPVGKNPAMILVDPKQGKAKIVPLVEHGETVVKSSQGKISKVDYRESELF